MNPHDNSVTDDSYIHISAAMMGQRAFRRHPSHVWEFEPLPKRRAGYTKNKRQGTPKAKRKMAAASRRKNRA